MPIYKGKIQRIKYQVSWIMAQGSSWIIMSTCHHVSSIMDQGSSGHHVIMLTFDLVISLYFLCHIVIRLKFLKGGDKKS